MMQEGMCSQDSYDACCNPSEIETPDCCSTKHSDCSNTAGETSPPKNQPSKCSCSCFCFGAIVADVFVVQGNQDFQQEIASIETRAWNLVLVDSITNAIPPPPDSGGHEHLDAVNRGRQICCQISVYLI